MLLSPLIFDPFAITNWTRETVGKTRLVYGDLGEWAAQKSPFPERCICWSWTDCFCLGNTLQKARQTESSSAVLPGSAPAPCTGAELMLCRFLCLPGAALELLCAPWSREQGSSRAASSEQGSWPSQGIGTWPSSAHFPAQGSGSTS